MNASRFLLASLTVTVALWAGLSMWRDTALRRWQRIERAFVTYYASRPSEHPAIIPPVTWDYESERLVEVPPGAYRVDESDSTQSEQPGMSAVLVKKTHEAAPMWTWGIVLGRVPAMEFHGAFAGLTLLLGFGAVRRAKTV